MKITIASLQYQLEPLENWQTYCDKISQIIKQAKQQHANVLLFPEYCALELCQWFPNTLEQQFEKLQNLIPDYVNLFKTLAQEYKIYIQAGTIPIKDKSAKFYNRAYFFGPHGEIGYQDKIFLTRFEKKSNLITAGKSLTLFNTEFGKIAIAICYDSEFPNLVHQLVKADANIILVPSCTETLHGFHRVHLSCRARALENQCYVIQSSLIGEGKWCEFIDKNVGQAGIFSPIDANFPNTGIIAAGTLNQPQLITAELSLADLNEVRINGQVTNFFDLLSVKNDLPIS